MADEEQSDQLPEAEIAARLDRALRRMALTPAQPRQRKRGEIARREAKAGQKPRDAAKK
jgi:hypothetical protein